MSDTREFQSAAVLHDMYLRAWAKHRSESMVMSTLGLTQDEFYEIRAYDARGCKTVMDARANVSGAPFAVDAWPNPDEVA